MKSINKDEPVILIGSKKIWVGNGWLMAKIISGEELSLIKRIVLKFRIARLYKDLPCTCWA